jgi:glucose-6-phosphate isomerase
MDQNWARTGRASRRHRQGPADPALFDDPPGGVFGAGCGAMLFDYAKTNIDARRATCCWTGRRRRGGRAARCHVRGAKINETEGRAVLHTAARRR